MKSLFTILISLSSFISYAQPKEIGFTNTNIHVDFNDHVRPASMKIDKDGNQYVIGMFKSSGYFNNINLSTLNPDCKGIFISKTDTNNQLVFVKKIAEEDSESYNGNIVSYLMEIDSNNNIYVGINFKSKLFLGTDTVVSNGEQDFVIVKYTPNCAQLYIKHIGSINDERISEKGMFISEDNNLLITGSFNNSYYNIYPNYKLSFGTDTLFSNSADIYYAKFDSNGNNIFVHSCNSVGTQMGVSIIEYQHNIYLLGITSSSFDTLFGITLSYGYSYNDKVFLLKLDMNSNGIWGKKMGSIDYNHYADANEMLISEGHIIIAGAGGGYSNFKTILHFDGGITLYGDKANFFLVVYDTLGNFVWNKISNDTNGSSLNNILVDDIGNIYITGGYYSDIVFDSITLNTLGGIDLYLASYDKNGIVRYATTGGGSYTETGMSLAINADKQIVLLGYTNSPGCIFSNDTIYPSANKSTLFVTTIDSVLLPPAPDAIDIIAKNLQDALVYPNPTNTTITIAYTQASTANISISNAMGQVVYVYRANHNYYNHKTVDIQHLHSGLYFITISDEKNKITKKINIQTNN